MRYDNIIPYTYQRYVIKIPSIYVRYMNKMAINTLSVLYYMSILHSKTTEILLPFCSDVYNISRNFGHIIQRPGRSAHGHVYNVSRRVWRLLWFLWRHWASKHGNSMIMLIILIIVPSPLSLIVWDAFMCAHFLLFCGNLYFACIWQFYNKFYHFVCNLTHLKIWHV